MTTRYKIALAGNPNSGKTTIFNQLTGAHQHTGNYPGVTVEIKEGTRRHSNIVLDIIDLPGTYNLTALSEEELVARNFIIENQPDVVIDVIDASSLERQLYLTIQLLELGTPLVLAFNMSDVAEHAGIEFDLPLLSELLGVPIVQTTGTRGHGIDELIETTVRVASKELVSRPKPLKYGRDLDIEIDRISEAIDRNQANPIPNAPSRWLAIKLLENDSHIIDTLTDSGDLSDDVSKTLEEAGQRLSQLYNDTPDILIAEARYGIISGAASEAVTYSIDRRHDFSDRLDKVFIHPFLGMPIFLIFMYLVFNLTFRIGNPFIGYLEIFFQWLGSGVGGLWPEGSESPLRSLLVDGIIGGVGGVLVFIPNIFLLFMAISFLEDTGYMARAAFIMDRLMHKIGLHGKSFIPMLIGFGCSVPAIMGTRILENPRDRIVTTLVIPLMSCSARLPVYTLIIPAFFAPKYHGLMLWLIYAIGIVLAVILTRLLRSTLFKGESTPFVMELPPYRVPTIKGLFIHSWARGYLYLRKAGTIILAISIILWWATSYPKVKEYSRDYSADVENVKLHYEQGVLSLNQDLGIPEDFRGILDAIHPDAENVGSAGETETGNESANEFILMVRDIVIIRSEFNNLVEEGFLEEGSPEHFLAESQAEDRVEELRENYPGIIPVAERYLDEILAPYNVETRLIRQQMVEEELASSLAGRAAHLLVPVLSPMGFDWKIGTALIGAFAAKEVFVAQLGIVYSVGDTNAGTSTLRETLEENYSPLIGFSIMLFILISAPCVATIAITRVETRSWKWALFQLAGLTVVAWILTTIVFQAGKILGLGG